MWRSILARRPYPLLSLYLRRHERRCSGARLGHGADGIPSRNYTSSEDNHVDRREEAKPVAAAPSNRYGCTHLLSPDHRRKHLYVVLPDWKKGFSIHKLDLDDGSDGGDLTERAPVLRQSNGHGCWSFAALGSKIIAAGRLKPGKEDCVTLVYDTETAGVSIVPRLPTLLCYGWSLATAAGNRLYTVVNGLRDGCMHCLEAAAPPTTTMDTDAQWSWSSVPSPLPFRVSLMDSIAVHPDGGLFVSMGEKDDDDFYEVLEAEHLGQDMQSRTYSYDPGSGEWRGHGDWGLPFYGQAHYNTSLDAWVGFHKGHGQYGHFPNRYICSCDVVSPTGSSVQPSSKLCTEMLSSSGGSLVDMGDSTYCLVEVEALERFKNKRCASIGNKCMIRLTMFCLEYDKNGELKITGRRSDRSYLFSTYEERYETWAFWM